MMPRSQREWGLVNGEALRQLREGLGLTQEAMAEHLGLALEVYARKERGQSGFAERADLARGFASLGLECSSPGDPLLPWLNSSAATIALDAHRPTWASQVLRPLGYDGPPDAAQQADWFLSRVRSLVTTITTAPNKKPRKRK